ncbi:MAG: hypothetical protein EKK37_15880 [Sphingobacteriales bacterium]|nr:MAG: hypothetical protein EKK37_15880 [Sphingobacteriales bacterium]
MRKFYHFISSLFITAAVLSCNTQRNIRLTGTNEENILTASEYLQTHPGNKKAIAQLKSNYEKAVANHQQKIKELSAAPDTGNYEMILGELSVLQDLSQRIKKLPEEALNTIAVNHYESQIMRFRDSAAKENYELALTYLSKENRDNDKKAYRYFLKADVFEPNYKDAKEKIKDVFERNIVTVVINPLFPKTSYDGVLVSEEFADAKKELVKDLGADLYKLEEGIPAKFYTSEEANEKNIKPDWVLDISLTEIKRNKPEVNTFNEMSRGVVPNADIKSLSPSDQVFASSSSTYITNSVKAEIQYTLRSNKTNEIIKQETVPSYYQWMTDNSGVAAIQQMQSSVSVVKTNNIVNVWPQKNNVMAGLFNGAYSDLVNKILYAVSW